VCELYSGRRYESWHHQQVSGVYRYQVRRIAAALLQERCQQIGEDLLSTAAREIHSQLLGPQLQRRQVRILEACKR